MNVLQVDVAKQLGGFALQVTFKSDARVLGLFGRSGAGKTLLLSTIAGLVRPDRGRIVIGDSVVDDTAARLRVPAYRRRIGYVFQDARLFPHMSVASNLDYGRRMNALAHDAAFRQRITDMLDIGALLERRVAGLSGGERQRVALGRALLAKPRLLLLDEPLASLDDTRKAEILPYLIRMRDDGNVPMIYVSHDADEMQQLATDVIVLENGWLLPRNETSS